MPEYLSPGLYYETVDASPPTISALRTDAVGFEEISVRSSLEMAARLTHGAGSLAYTIHTVLENGGRCCPVVRVASRDQYLGASMANTIFNPAGQPGRKIEASSPGVWGNQLSSSNDVDAPVSDNCIIPGDGSSLSASRVNYWI